MEFNEAFFLELGRSPAVEAACREPAQQIMSTIQSTAPEDTGDYKAGFEIRTKHQKRVVVEVVGTDKKTLLIESKLGVMAKALQRAKRGHRG